MDTGLVSSLLNLQLHEIKQLSDINLINQGGLSEQVVGQLLRSMTPFYLEPQLYYWTHVKAGTNAEIDYLIQNGMRYIPIEVKSSTTGSLKSLHYFMSEKNFHWLCELILIILL